MATATEATAKPKTARRTRPQAAPRAAATAEARPTPPRRETSDSSDYRAQIDRSVEVTDQVLEQLENGGQQVIGAVRRFVTSVDDALPGSDDGPTRAHDVIDSALEMSDRIVEVGGDAIRGIVQSAGRSLGTAKK